MSRVLLCWIGHADLKASRSEEGAGLGPIGKAVEARPFDRVTLLSDYTKATGAAYVKWLRGQTDVSVTLIHAPLSSPTHFGEIHEAAVRAITEVAKGPDTTLTFHLSPGTPAMAAVWILLAKTRFNAELIESSPQKGVQTASVPFDISAEYIPNLLRRPDEQLVRASVGTPAEIARFADIVYRSPEMHRVVERAKRAAPRAVPVLIEGESGTGKELFARAIHQASPRNGKFFVAVNCGAIPAELLEAELFGHERGAFTGAAGARVGHFEAAHEGTLFLDEIGELPAQAQVKLLRTLQEGEVQRLGSSKPRKIDVRVIAATNRTLAEEVATNRFREDLFYRLAVATLHLPPLRDRAGDIGSLVDLFLEKANEDSKSEPGYQQKTLSAGARNLLLAHTWPGNVRELQNTILRAVIWSPKARIEAEDIADAFLPRGASDDAGILHRPLGNGLDLPELLASVARHYLSRAMDEARGNKTKAAELVGLPSYQTLTNWLAKYDSK
jgi:DNA-binding NtrC family response regulator